MSDDDTWRGQPIPIPLWWWHDFENAVGKLTDDIEKLTDEVVRAKVNEVPLPADERPTNGWSRETINKFRHHKFPTLELVEAICLAFKLERPVFVAQDPIESKEMAKARADHNELRSALMSQLVAEQEANTESSANREIRERVEPGAMTSDEIAIQKDEAYKRNLKNTKARKRRALAKQK